MTFPKSARAVRRTIESAPRGRVGFLLPRESGTLEQNSVAFKLMTTEAKTMRSLRFHKTSSLDDLRVEEVPIPTPSEDEVLVQVKAAAINPSDVKNVQGKMHETTVPRIPGRDFSGVVVGGRGALSGQSVFGSGGDLGFGRDGSHAEFVVVPANAVIPLPRNLSFEQAAGIGVAYMTAWAALVNAARIQPGETALILGTTGAVGSAAARIAHSLGGRACTAQVDAGPGSEGSPAICARTTVGGPPLLRTIQRRSTWASESSRTSGGRPGVSRRRDCIGSLVTSKRASFCGDGAVDRGFAFRKS